MLNKILRLAIYALVSLGVATSTTARVTVALTQGEEPLASRQLENVHIKAQSLGQLVSDFSLHCDVPIGLEIALDDDEAVGYYLDFKKGTLTDLLTQFVTDHKNYTWEIKDGVVNIFPKGDYRDAIVSELLAVQISKFSIDGNTSCWSLEDSLGATNEVRRIVEARGLTYIGGGGNFTGFYIPQAGRHFTLQVSDMTLKAILNGIIKKSPVARVWVIKRYGSNQTFYIRLNARLEHLPNQQ